MEFKKGKLSGLHLAGEKVEQTFLIAQEEEKRNEIIHNTYSKSKDAIKTQSENILAELKQRSVTIGEFKLVTDILNKVINTCQQFCDISYTDYILAKGAVAITKKNVSDIKSIYDLENEQLIAQEIWMNKNAEEKLLKERPVGAYPGNPIKDLKISKKTR